MKRLMEDRSEQVTSVSRREKKMKKEGREEGGEGEASLGWKRWWSEMAVCQ